MKSSFRSISVLYFAVAVAGLLPSAAARAQTAAPAYPNQKEDTFVARNFKFQTGDVFPEIKLHYITVGTPHKNAQGEIDNAVLLLHGTTGTGKNYLAPSLGGQLFGPGQPLDATKFYLIMPDGIGRGGSSKPSDGLRARFPKYGYTDVVEGQYRLLTEGLAVKHLRLIVGTSMGGMQGWMWGERYPDFMDAIMPIASQPIAVSGRNMLWRRLAIEAIRDDPDWNNGNYTKEPSHFNHFLPIFTIMTESPVRLQEQAPTRAKANELYDTLIANYGKVDANDYLYWVESSYDYNPAPELEKIKARLLAVNFADDELNPPELGIMEKEVPKVKNGRFVVIPPGGKSHGHMTLTQAVVWKNYLAELLNSTGK
jgi:homoserine O-acetyltransferase/O-succinyltransferase